MTSNIRAILGSTNTGKTHLACARLFAHQSGMIGLPLRLLAREVYDRALRGDFDKRIHPADIALITGEERIIPPRPRYFICTTEAMPQNKDLEFVALDECQLAQDPERGHIFCERILHWRGTFETMFLGSPTIAPLLKQLIPEIEIETRTRFSQLTYSRPRKLSRLPKRSAVIAFTANDVYAIAEHIRRQHGGAAVVMGALSPRTRNAQVALYQSGAVDYLVATDAIGMGLNMDINHIAFARTHKFDGRRHRRLTAPELAQIAGRAGRHKRDGTFSNLAGSEPLEESDIARIEAHEFEPIKNIMWRNTRLDFSSIDALITSLEQPPPQPHLIRSTSADDLRALKILRTDPEIISLATTPAALEILWTAAQIPDYRKTTAGAHAELIAQVFKYLATQDKIPDAWLAEQIEHCDRTDGELDALGARIAAIRTCTYIAQHPHWVGDATGWQEASGAVEARLSDALHAKLTAKFVDKKSAALAKTETEQAIVNDNADIILGGEVLGRIDGLKINRSAQMKQATAAVKSAFDKTARAAVLNKAATISAATDFTRDTFTRDTRGAIFYNKEQIAQIYFSKNSDYLSPQIKLDADDSLPPATKTRIAATLAAWLSAELATSLAPLFALRSLNNISPAARALAFRLIESHGNITRREVNNIVNKLQAADRRTLKTAGVRLGFYNIYLPALLKPAARETLIMLATIKDATQNTTPPELPASGITSSTRNTATPPQIYRTAGFYVAPRWVIRFDMLERAANILRPLIKDGQEFILADAPREQLLSLMGCNQTELIEILTDLNYRHKKNDDDALHFTPPAKTYPKTKHSTKNKHPTKPKQKPQNKDTPFAVLKNIKNELKTKPR